MVRFCALHRAGGGQNSRTTQIWIAFKDSKHLGKAYWETPFGQVRSRTHLIACGGV